MPRAGVRGLFWPLRIRGRPVTGQCVQIRRNPREHPAHLCFARKVGRFASKIGRLASKRPQQHRERAFGGMAQAWTKGPYDPLTVLRGVCHLPKTCVVAKVGRDCQKDWPPGATAAVFCPPKRVGRASVFAAKVCGKMGDPRPRFLATPSRHAGDGQRRRQA